VLDRSEVAAAAGALRGGYTLWQSGEGEPDVIVLATGSELSIALDGARSLSNGAVVRVVSLPCWELFEQQPQDYREEVLPPDVRARVSLEAGITHGWERWVGDHGVSIGVDRFGASAPYTRIYEELGLTPERVVAESEALLQRVG
jgi:transketolase